MPITPRTIFLKGDPDFKERAASGVITPGQLIRFTTGDAVVRHDVAKGNQNGMFAIENALKGLTIDDDYADGGRVQFIVADQGDEVYAQLTTSQTVVEGDFLESKGDGNLQKHVSEHANSTGIFAAGHIIQAKGLVGVALEAVTTTNAVKRIKIQVC